MTTRHRLLLPSLLACLAMLAVVLWPRTAITRENAAKIQAGMTLPEVAALLGGPARDEGMGVAEDLVGQPVVML
jgi:hypothetical protein